MLMRTACALAGLQDNIWTNKGFIMSRKEQKVDPEEVRARVTGKMKIYIRVAVLLALYYIWVRSTGLAAPCPIHALTGLYCPGCGITRLLMALAVGDISTAYYWNPGLFWIAPVAVLDVIWYHYVYFRYGEQNSRFHSMCICIMIVVLLVFCVWRNIA